MPSTSTAISALLISTRLCRSSVVRAPLLRVRVQRRSESSFQLSLSFHHAILDGWSAASFMRELLKARYSAAKTSVIVTSRSIPSSRTLSPRSS